MKDQYFGDVNDYRKYGLLRSLVTPYSLRLGVCWMLTEPDGRTDGKFVAYISRAGRHRDADPELFDWLKEFIASGHDRCIAQIETSGLLGSAVFQSSILTDDEDQRSIYFADSAKRFAGCDLVFFDPDNGMEIKSTRRKHKNSCKYIYWDEVRDTFMAGSSVLIYQHFIREEREEFIATKTTELQRRTGATAVFSFRTPHVVFFLASQERHANIFRERVNSIRSAWHPAHIAVAELSVP